MTQRDTAKFRGSFTQTMEQLLSGTNKAAVDKLDDALCQKAATTPNMETVIA